jgi:F420H(2)-dependent quinone reductase
MSLLSAKHLRICQCSWILAGEPWSTELADPLRDDMFPAALKEGTMAEAKLAPNQPDWMVEHANRYLSSGGTDGHMYKTTVPGLGEITAPALLLTTTGRKSGDKFILPLFYGTDGGSYFVIASKGGAPLGYAYIEVPFTSSVQRAEMAGSRFTMKRFLSTRPLSRLAFWPRSPRPSGSPPEF